MIVNVQISVIHRIPFCILQKKPQTNKKTHFLNDLFDLLGLDLQKSPTDPQPPVYFFFYYMFRGTWAAADQSGKLCFSTLFDV